MLGAWGSGRGTNLGALEREGRGSARGRRGEGVGFGGGLAVRC